MEPIISLPIETDRLILRKFKLDDIYDYFKRNSNNKNSFTCKK